MAYWNHPYYGVPDSGPPPTFPPTDRSQEDRQFNENAILNIPPAYNAATFNPYYPSNDFNSGYNQNVVWADQLESQQINQYQQLESKQLHQNSDYVPSTSAPIKSNLTATAVEFKPSGNISMNYTANPVVASSNEDSNLRTQTVSDKQYPTRAGAVKKAPMQSIETRSFHSKRNSQPKQDYYPNQNDRKNSKYERYAPRSYSSPKNFNVSPDKLEQSKNDGRKKLLEEAAKFLNQPSSEKKYEEPKQAEPRAHDRSNRFDSRYQNSPNRYSANQRPGSRSKYNSNLESNDRDSYDQQYNRTSSRSRGNVALSYRNNTVEIDNNVYESDRHTPNQSQDSVKGDSYNRDQYSTDRNNARYSNRGRSGGQAANKYNYNKSDYSRYNRGNQYRDNYNSRRTDFDKTSNDSSYKSEPSEKSETSRPSSPINTKPKSNRSTAHPKSRLDDAASQRERLTEQVARGSLECLVCCERVRPNDFVWSCQNCYHILHLNCVRKWATSSKAESGWRCPACQHVSMNIPSDYFCYCARVRNPTVTINDIPHSCGEMCGKKSRRINCNHRCTLLCHPGPCPQCEAFVKRKCGCGATTQSVLCNSESPVLCEGECRKQLGCTAHICAKKCHMGDCQPCDVKFTQVCYCKKESKEVKCTVATTGRISFSCGDICGKKLECGNHSCDRVCHEGPCADCQLSPAVVDACACGQTKLTPAQQRTSCLDPIPCCEKICSKRLNCGQPFAPHTCKSKCHDDVCPPCDLSTLVRCRCGHMDRELPCTQLTGRPDDARCEKKCTKKRTCGRHKCNGLCCIEIDHECMLPCNRMLSCGLHRCEQTCHRGRCLPCYRSSFEELFCECGLSVIYPPVPCGTRRPTCSQPCSRVHECSHEVLHNCHDEPTCPPCTILTHKWCYGKHELRKTIPCHQKTFSCGRPCGKDLPCGRHKCIASCHDGPCLPGGKPCVQPCTTTRVTCGHPCALPCHEGPCQDTPCKETVKVTCQCGNRTTMRNCVDNVRDYQRIATAKLASKMADMQLGHTIEIDDIVGNKALANLKTLECNDDCRVIERNRRLAIGLQIRNPDLSAKLTPRYSDYMKQWGKKDPRFCQNVHDKLTELVQLAKQSKQKSRSHSFESMNRDKRQFIHDYCEHFGCDSAAYDQEPNRNVVASASRDKAWLPSHSLLEMLQREAGQRKVPGPVLRAPPRPATAAASSSQSVSLRLSSRDSTSSRGDAQGQSASMSAITLLPSSIPETPVIDYFDGPG